ncbi:hypothetical protein BU17DRAFT_68117 [Hysterangium stoloniferum]|nr:hypothetical protein BU17DRAFT_68117 [Hysterangium stoloniferum]
MVPLFDPWNVFVRRYNGLDRELQQFHNAVQDFGNLFDLLDFIQSIRDGASMIFWILADNATQLHYQDASQFQPSFGNFQRNPGTGPTQPPGVYTFRGSLKPIPCWIFLSSTWTTTTVHCIQSQQTSDTGLTVYHHTLNVIGQRLFDFTSKISRIR